MSKLLMSREEAIAADTWLRAWVWLQEHPLDLDVGEPTEFERNGYVYPCGYGDCTCSPECGCSNWMFIGRPEPRLLQISRFLYWIQEGAEQAGVEEC